MRPSYKFELISSSDFWEPMFITSSFCIILLIPSIYINGTTTSNSQISANCHKNNKLSRYIGNLVISKNNRFFDYI